MTTPRQSLGAFGEKYAVAHLTRAGYRVVATNARVGRGEIDIVAWDGPTLAFIEVRTRRGTSFGTPEESITARKAERMARLAYQYMEANQLSPTSWRIDVVAIKVAPSGRVSRISVIKSAVGEGGTTG